MLHKLAHQILKRDAQTFPEKKQQLLAFLREHPVGVLSSVSPEGQPHGSVVYFAIDRDENFAIITKTLTTKYRNLQQHPEVMLTCFDPATQTTASIIGKATEVQDHFELNAIAGAIMSASLKTTEAGTPPITKLKAGSYAAFTIQPEKLHMVTYNSPGRKGYDELFETVQSFELHPQ